MFPPNASNESFTKSLQSFSDWSENWQLNIAYSKCNVLHIGSNNPRKNYFLGNQALEPVNCMRDLGVIVSSDLKPHIHIRSICSKAYQRVCLLFRAFRSKDSSNYVRAFNVYVRPTLEYCSVAWNPKYQSDIDLVEKVQRLFTRRLFQRCSDFPNHYEYPGRLKLLKLHSLETRRQILDLCMCYNIVFNHVNIDCNEFFVIDQQARTRGNSRKIRKLENSRVNARQHFFSVRVIDEWNKLSDDVIMSENVSIFKRKLLSLDRFCIQ